MTQAIFTVRKSLGNIAFPHFLGKAVADVNGASHLLIRGKIDFVLIGLTRDMVFQLRLLKRAIELNPELKQAVMQWHTDIYTLLKFTSNSTI